MEKEVTMRPYQVEVKNGKSPIALDFAIKRLRELLKSARIMETFNEHTEFTRPAQKRRIKKNRSINRYKWDRIKEARPPEPQHVKRMV